MKERKLYRSATDKRMFGLIGGIAEYFDCSSKLLRTIAIIIFLLVPMWPMFIGLYILLGMLVPAEAKGER